MRRRFLALWAAAVTVLAGCASGHHAAAQSTTSSTVPAGPNPDVIPAVITPAYVDAVFKVLNHVYGDATRSLVASRSVTPDVERDLRAIFTDPLYSQQIAQARQSLGLAIKNVKTHPGDAVTTVRNLVGSTSDCIFAETSTTLADVLVTQTPSAASEYYKLSLKASGNDPTGLNPTPWAISFNADYLTPTSLGNQCASSR